MRRASGVRRRGVGGTHSERWRAMFGEGLQGERWFLINWGLTIDERDEHSVDQWQGCCTDMRQRASFVCLKTDRDKPFDDVLVTF